MNELNIVELIEKNPITKLNGSYQSKLIEKIQKTFNNYEQQMFLASFYCYLKHDNKNDFIIDLDNIWKWLGFQQKYHAKYLLEKQFTINNDYKIIAPEPSGAKKSTRGGHNKEIIMLNIETFKKFCLKAGTKKADEIHDYFIKLEKILHQIIEEESNELRLQLEQKEEELEENKLNSEKEKLKAAEKATILQFPVNTECIYFGIINNTNELNEKLIKFGHTNNLAVRVREHKKNYNDFILINAFKVPNKVEIENLIKKDIHIKKQIRNIEVNEKMKNEIIAYNNHFTIEKLINIIKNIIRSKTYSIENFNKLMENNDFLENENGNLKE
ncbi:MAG: hypothetical protein HN879_01810, partial [Flavobacteriaceae bacterium]|nr:hypothetical protein [Flavobacteriaceae bacterium]